MKTIIYASKDSKNGVKGLKYLLSNPNIDVKGCLITGECQEIRRICSSDRIPIYDDERREKIKEDFADSAVDLLISFSYPIKIEDYIINKAKCGINFHPAPLPEYKGRGCACHAIYNGEKEWAGTFHVLTSRLDEGGIIVRKDFKIAPNVQYGMQLSDITWNLGYEMLKDLITDYIKFEKIVYVEQEKGGKYYSQKDLDEVRKISEKDSADVIERKIKAFWFPPYEGAYVERDGEHFSVVTKELLLKIGQKENV